MRRADLPGMATHPIPRRALTLAALTLLLAVPGRGAAEALDARTPRGPTVAYYDADAVLDGTSAFAGERAGLDRLIERYDAESAPVRSEVDALRSELRRSVAWPADQRRDLETRLAGRTIALLVQRSEGAREIARTRAALLADEEQRIVRTVARVAGEHALSVVVRTNGSTRLLDQDAMDLTPLVIAALDAESGAPERSAPGERRRMRLQSCDPEASERAGE